MFKLKGDKDTDAPNPDLLATKFKEAIQSETDRILMDAALQPYVPPPAPVTKKKPIINLSDDESDDINFDEDDAMLDRIYTDRRAAMIKYQTELSKYTALGHGVYDILTQSDFLPAVTGSKYALVHFFHKDFERCKIMGKHINILAPKYVPVLMRSIDSEKTPFFVEKLAIRTLPTVILFKDGVAIDRIVGFADLGNTDEFSTEVLENRLKKSGIMKRLKDPDMEEEDDDLITAYVSPIRESTIDKTMTEDNDM